MNAVSFNVILVDDEPRGLNIMEKMLELHCPDVHIAASCKNADEAIDQIRSIQPELVFLDIAMPVKTGFDLLNELQEFSFEIIFVTAYNQYMIEAFHFSAVDYLLKPISKDRFDKACWKAKEYFDYKSAASVSREFIFVKAEGKFEKLYFSEIMYVEAMENYLSIFTSDNKRLIVLNTLKSFLLTLPPEKFMQTHKSFIIAVDWVTRIEGNSIIIGRVQIPVARKNKQHVMDFIVKKVN